MAPASLPGRPSRFPLRHAPSAIPDHARGWPERSRALAFLEAAPNPHPDPVSRPASPSPPRGQRSRSRSSIVRSIARRTARPVEAAADRLSRDGARQAQQQSAAVLFRFPRGGGSSRAFPADAPLVRGNSRVSSQGPGRRGRREASVSAGALEMAPLGKSAVAGRGRSTVGGPPVDGLRPAAAPRSGGASPG